MKKGEILEKEGLRILRLEGSPYEMGYQHGKALSEEIRWLHSNLKHLFAHYEGILGKLAFPVFRLASKILERNIPNEFREEMRGISDGAGVDYNSVRLVNLTEELGEIFYSYLKPFKCSCFVAKDVEGNIIWGRNLDYLFYEILPVLNIVFVYVPQQGFPFISLSWPGVIGVPTGISRDLSLILNSSPAKPRIFKGIPQQILTRQVIQYSKDLREGLRRIIFTPIPATMGQNLVLVSKNDARVIEISPRKNAVRCFQEEGYITVTNHFKVPEMEAEQVSPIKPRKTSIPDELLTLFFTLEGSKRRAEKMKMALQNNHIDLKKAMEILDSVSGPGTVQSVICIPQKEEFWVAKRNQPPVTKGEWVQFKLRDLL